MSLMIEKKISVDLREIYIEQNIDFKIYIYIDTLIDTYVDR